MNFRDGVEQACDAFAPVRQTEHSPGAATQFTTFTDVDDNRVRVQLSSAAMRECARIYVDLADWQIGKSSVGLHLCRCMAAELWNALQIAFDGTLDSQPYCDESGRKS